MLPWLFGVLLLLNVALFFWGQERERSREPELTPVPEGQYEIQLLSEREPTDETQLRDPTMAEMAPTGVGQVDVDVETAEGELPPEPPSVDLTPAGETAVGEPAPPALAPAPESEPQEGELPTPRTDPAESEWRPSEPDQEGLIDPETAASVADAADDIPVAEPPDGAGENTAELFRPDELVAEPADSPPDNVHTPPVDNPEQRQDRASDGGQ